MKSPDYTVRDLVFYIGLFGGIIVTSQLMERQFDTHRIVNLLCGGAVGYVLGGLLLKIYDSMKASSHRDDFNDDWSSKNDDE